MDGEILVGDDNVCHRWLSGSSRADRKRKMKLKKPESPAISPAILVSAKAMAMTERASVLPIMNTEIQNRVRDLNL